MKDEFLASIDDRGNLLNKPVKRSEAHRLGLWHRSISVFVLNPNGEILIERRSEHKDLFPGYYDIVGGHLQFGQRPSDVAITEINEEIALDVNPERLVPLCSDDELIEHVVIPEKGIINLERKTVYLLEIDSEEETSILRQSAKLSVMPAWKLKKRGNYGEVDHIEFWSWERLGKALQPQSKDKLASGTHSSLSHKGIKEKVRRRCVGLRVDKRIRFAEIFPWVQSNKENSPGLNDDHLKALFLPKPSKKASDVVLFEIFEDGPGQQAGAYVLAMLRNRLAGDPIWDAKYKDPEDRYVDNLLGTISYGLSKKERSNLIEKAPIIKKFVEDLLELPLIDGRRFRDAFGNLMDIAVARSAVLTYLQNDSDFLSKEMLDNPTRNITAGCLNAGDRFFERCLKDIPENGIEKLDYLIRAGFKASSTDFNNPLFREQLELKKDRENPIFEIICEGNLQELNAELGGKKFLHDFYETYIKYSPDVNISYLPGTASQALFSLFIAQELLRQNKNAKITFIPKTGNPGNDLSYGDTVRLLGSLSREHFRYLSECVSDKRFVNQKNGPMTHGLDPAGLHTSVARALSEADVIIAEGQAYAEIRGWKKPVYIAFGVNGRIARAIHGNSAAGQCGFVRLTPGVNHFQMLGDQINTKIGKRQLAHQTTSQYVKAILHENLNLISKKIFLGDLNAAINKVKEEAVRKNITFADVIIGHASQQPDERALKAFKERHYSVFAFGGGGGFSAVTLQALRKLGLPTVAGVPSTDDGGSTGELQSALRPVRGFVFGVGDLASIVENSLNNESKKAILSFRFPEEPTSLVQGVIDCIDIEIRTSTSTLGAADDFLSFVCDQLNLARIIDSRFRKRKTKVLPLRGASIRNLNVIAAFELCNALGDATNIDDNKRMAALIVLEKALALPQTLIAQPVTFEEGDLYLDYSTPITSILQEKLPQGAFDKSENRVYGQQHIDQLPHSGGRKMVGVKGKENRPPKASEEYLRLLREAELIIMGAGSLISSQLSQMAISGVVDVLLESQDKRRVLVLNHVKMDETMDMSVKDHIQLIENVAQEMSTASVRYMTSHGGAKKLRISDIFTDIVVPRTIAREIENEMAALSYESQSLKAEEFEFVKISASNRTDEITIFCNRYVDFLRKNPKIKEKYGVTLRELEILSFQEQPRELYKGRSEKGRYRGALYATETDIAYLTKQGIQLRNIHEVDSIGKNLKILKTEGKTEFEEFPGLIPQSLMGIFQLALEKGINDLDSY
jgi:2-phospho-L-lactate transferase/gluconeogenesis factor (CofD/UPF0052 family)/8-oxo-dGTP pyrophosphatase MutT (NUDIX family)